MTFRVAIYAFPNMEVLDFAGPFEVFTTASRVYGRENPGQPAPFEVCTIAQSVGPIQARAGLRVLPDYTLATCPQPGILLIPGGVVDAELRNSEVIDWVAQCSKSVSVTASVCTGAFIIAKAGLLAGRRATTHWEDIADLQAAFPDVQVVDNKRWVDEGAVVSSAGIAAGIDMSLHLVARFAGHALAEATARQMDVPYVREA
ncbi:MAG TPA: DJ-1/PfpI family protein [Burkholderiaceae bacterium]|nr:DJ-1/PfpI family protein [Burkholderiaceae bacterium]